MITLTTYVKAVSKGVLILVLIAGVVLPHAAEAQQAPSDTGATSGGGTAVQGTGQTSVVQTLQGWLNRLVPANTGTPETAGNPGSGGTQQSGGSGFWSFLTGGNNTTNQNPSGNSFSNWLARILTGGTPSDSGTGQGGGQQAGGGSTNPSSVQSGGWGGSTADAVLDQGAGAVNGFLDLLTYIGHSPMGQLFSDLFAPAVDATRGVINPILNAAIGAGIDVSNRAFNFNTTNPGTPANNGNANIPSLPAGMNNVITTYDSAGNPVYHVTTYDAQGYAIGTVSYDSKGNPINTVIYDSEGNPVSIPNAARPGGSGPSIPGASKGTVGNPFSDGTDKNDAASDNDEISPFANPYLFEYDPSSTNNNPKGDEAIEQ